MKKNDLIELNIEKYAAGGFGIAKTEKSIIKPNNSLDAEDDKQNYIVFVSGAYPGDKVLARLNKIKKSYAEASVVKLITGSNDRTKPRCKYFGTCGGCKQQDFKYAAQLKHKQSLVIETFEHIGRLTDYNFEEIIPSDNIFYYRNKMEFSFSDKRWLTKDELERGETSDRNFALGLHIPRIYDKVLDINECFLQSELSNQILNFTREFFKENGMTIYSTKTHMGYLRNLVIKQSANTKDLMVNLVTSAENDEMMQDYTSELIKVIPKITTVVNNINFKKASVAVGDYEKIIYGEGYIFDTIGNYKFRISANSFFQTNTVQSENLYKTAMEFADLTGNKIVYDLYSGAGTIAIYLSDKIEKVYGFESVESAVKDANENAKINAVENVEFIMADLYNSFLPNVEKNKIPRPDVIIIDPPRSGMHKNTVDDVISLSPEKIVYVSCNPATQARDIRLMVDAGYQLKKMRPVDMFPHTYHIENVALLHKSL